MYETLIGWRYLYRRPQEHGRLFAALFLIFTGVAVISAMFWLVSKKPPPWSVVMFLIGSVSAIVVGLLNVFTVFTSVSVFGVVLGVSSLTMVLSVTSGFQSEFQAKVLGVNAHVLVMKSTQDFKNYREVEEMALAMKPDVLAVQPFAYVEMLVTRGKGELAGIAMKGVDPDKIGTVLDLPQHIIDGSIDVLRERVPGEPAPVIIGKELAHKLKAKIGDELTLVVPNLSFSSSTARAPKTRKVKVGAIFYSGFDEYDRRLLYVDIKEAQDLLGEGDVVMGVEMKLSNPEHARAVAKELESKLGGDPYIVMDWRELNNNLFTALTLQKVALVVFLTLIIIVAAFNMIASLTMMVLDKTKEIAILKSMGGSARGVATVFQIVGLTVGAVGTAVGLSLGLALCTVVAKFGYPLDPKVYLIDRLPIKVHPSEVVMVGVITMVICFVATLYPALKASRLRPVEGLRYE